MALKQTLDKLVRQSQKSGQPARVRLEKGLIIAVRAQGSCIDLQLARADVYPSTQEWKTVIQQWPGQATVTKPPRGLKGDLYYLKGQIHVVAQLVG